MTKQSPKDLVTDIEPDEAGMSSTFLKQIEIASATWAAACGACIDAWFKAQRTQAELGAQLLGDIYQASLWPGPRSAAAEAAQSTEAQGCAEQVAEAIVETGRVLERGPWPVDPIPLPE